MVKGDTPAQDRINKSQFEALCRIMCTKEEIADIFEVDADTLNAWCKKIYGDTFSVVYKKKSAKGKMSLRRYQFEQAKKNPTLAIWLGKQWLGQSDKIENIHTNVEKKPLQIEVIDNSYLKGDMYESNNRE